jgi:thiol:disulfide interchange protein DsbA
MIKRLLLSLPLLLLSLSCAAAEEPKETYIAGTHYDVISPVVRSADPDKIEVAEFFWYGCGHCYSFEPALQQWKKTLADDVAFVGVPAIWNEKMALHAAAFYTAETLGVLDTMHDVIFQAMNVDRKQLATQAEIEALFTANGVSAEDFNKTFNSFGVGSQVRQAGSLAKAAKITGTPALVVDGKYHVSARKAGSQADMLKVVDFLVEKERVARGGK